MKVVQARCEMKKNSKVQMSKKEKEEIKMIKEDLCKYNEETLLFKKKDARRLAQLMTSGFYINNEED
jgi:hypothetical protein